MNIFQSCITRSQIGDFKLQKRNDLTAKTLSNFSTILGLTFLLISLLIRLCFTIFSFLIERSLEFFFSEWKYVNRLKIEGLFFALVSWFVIVKHFLFLLWTKFLANLRLRLCKNKCLACVIDILPKKSFCFPPKWSKSNVRSSSFHL